MRASRPAATPSVARPALPENDPFNATYSDPVQRAPRRTPRAPAPPPSARGNGIITEL
ncbi:MAG: hypothetical protein R3A52_13895 [Polyangiales bacterium]